MKVVSLWLLMALALTACSGRTPTLAQTSSDDDHAPEPAEMNWTRYGPVEDHSPFGTITLTMNSSGYGFMLNDEDHRNVMIEVQTQQQSPRSATVYGVVCRAEATPETGAEPAGLRGYLFLISADGQYTILRSDGDVRQAAPLMPWRASILIRTGMARNEIRAECVGDQLLLLVNDAELARLRDPRPLEGGRAALVIGTLQQPERDAVEQPQQAESMFLAHAAELDEAVSARTYHVEVSFEQVLIREDIEPQR